MTLDELRKDFDAINEKIHETNRQRRNEYSELENARVAPLLKEIAEIKADIQKVVSSKYDGFILNLQKELHEVDKKMDVLKIERAQSLWYPAGTIVHYWDQSGRHSPVVRYFKREKTGVVAIYDGTQKLDKRGTWKWVHEGDIIVIHHKKNGQLSMQYDIISRGGKEPEYASWWADGDTPTENIITRKQTIQS